MEYTWAYYHSSNRWISPVVSTHRYTCTFLTTRLHMENTWAYYHSSNWWISPVVSTHRYTCTFLTTRLHMEHTWAYYHSSNRWISPAVSTHRYTCAFLILKINLIEWIIGYWQRSCSREIEHSASLSISWYCMGICVSSGVESRSLWFLGNLQILCRWNRARVAVITCVV